MLDANSPLRRGAIRAAPRAEMRPCALRHISRAAEAARQSSSAGSTALRIPVVLAPGDYSGCGLYYDAERLPWAQHAKGIMGSAGTTSKENQRLRALLLKTLRCNARLTELDSAPPIRSQAVEEANIQI